MRSAHTAAVLAAFACLGGCLLTSDFDGVAGERPQDSGASSVDGGGSGSSDGAAGADGAAPEGDAEAGTEAGASPCTGTHVFCTDFDQTSALPVPGWSSSSTQGSLALDAAQPVSAPSSLRAKVQGTGTSNAYLFRNVFITSYVALSLAFDFRVNDCAGQGTNAITFAYLGLAADVAYGFVLLSSGELAVGAQVSGTATFFNLTTPIAKGAWRHAVMAVRTKSPTLAHLTMTVDGASSVDTDAPSGATSQTVLLNIGANGSGAPKGCDVSFDNVVLDKE